MIELIGARVTSLDVDFHEVTWKVAPTGEDVLDYEIRVFRSESEEGPWDDLTGPLVDRYHFIDNVIQIQNRWRRYYYLLQVTKRGSDETRDFGPVSNEPQPDLVAMELRRHLRLLFNEFAGRRCIVLPRRTFGMRCFLPGTVMQGAVVGASRAMYKGKAVEVRTKKGFRLSVTANHPVLTKQGFTSAESLRVGDNLVCYGSEPGVSPPALRSEGYEYQKPALAEDVFRTLSERGVIQTTRGVGLDFHGESKRFIGDIEVVGSYRDLLLNSQAASAEQVRDFVLKQSNFSESDFSRSSSPNLFLQRHSPAAHSPMGGFGHPGPGLPRAISPSYVARFGDAAQSNSSLAECISDGTSRNLRLVGELFDRGAGLVTEDEVIEVREYNYLGHVYDFESLTGWMVASDIFTSNCSCWNPTLEKRTRSGCAQCFDTSWVRGYLHPIEAWIQVDPSPKTRQTTGTGSVTEQDNTTMRMGYYPAVKPDDLIIEAENKRWRVIQQNQTEHSRAPVHQELQVHRIPEKDIEFRIPVSFETALPNLYFTPQRNFTNPQNLSNTGNDQLPGIFSIYRY